MPCINNTFMVVSLELAFWVTKVKLLLLSSPSSQRLFSVSQNKCSTLSLLLPPSRFILPSMFLKETRDTVSIWHGTRGYASQPYKPAYKS
mmetsp:Transcript_114462/g.199090  ORF Transcript_114462/g.199090 Transcript_114462/m.199090 type:complete len:90 (+) Transcript_114462:1333-1602(+)